MTKEVRAEITALEVPHRKKSDELILPKFPEETLALIEKPVTQRTPLEHQIAELAYRQVTYEHYRMKVTGVLLQLRITGQRNQRSIGEASLYPLRVAPRVYHGDYLNRTLNFREVDEVGKPFQAGLAHEWSDMGKTSGIFSGSLQQQSHCLIEFRPQLFLRFFLSKIFHFLILYC